MPRTRSGVADGMAISKANGNEVVGKGKKESKGDREVMQRQRQGMDQ